MAEILIYESRKSKLKWKDIPKFKGSYCWPIVQVQEHEGSLHFKFSGGSKYSPNTYFTIEDYRKLYGFGDIQYPRQYRFLYTAQPRCSIEILPR